MLNPDFKELLELFNEAKIRFLLVGGYALAVHGVPRFTGDLDLWVGKEIENARKIIIALDEFGLGSLNLKDRDFLEDNKVVQIGYPPVRIDILTSIDGVDFEKAWETRIEVKMEGTSLPCITREDLILNKKASGRTQDIADLEKLLQISDP